MKKRLIFIFPYIIILILVIINIYLANHPKILYQNIDSENKTGLLSMLVENDEGGYKESTSNEWPQDYLLNKELSRCENGGTLEYQDNNVYVKAKASDRCYLYFAKNTQENRCLLHYEDSLVCDLIKKYNNQEIPTLYYHDQNLLGGAQDFSYRFSGASAEVDNFVCLDGATISDSCKNQDADLYRIIGLFKNKEGNYEAKLIKYDYATLDELGKNGAAYKNYTNSVTKYKGNNAANIVAIQWNSTNGSDMTNNTNTHMWRYSNLNAINLNTNFYNYIINKFSTLKQGIVAHTWNTGGLPTDGSGNALTVYNKELGTGKIKVNDNQCYGSIGSGEVGVYNTQPCTLDDIEYDAPIGLMYISEVIV